MATAIIETKDLRKSFKDRKREIVAVDGVNLSVDKGEVFGFLGPNGAGKTTTLRMLTTLLPIDGGTAIVAGIDVRKHPGQVRQRVGYVSQEGGNDPEATGLEDLVLQGRLYGMSQHQVTSRAAELATTLQLEDFIGRKTKTYSGGQKRRLNVASGIMHRPDVLFLDEPTTGLDPQNRANLWDQVRQLRNEGTTIFLTTHYLEEADVLSDHLAIMDNGKIVAEGTPKLLKSKIAGDSIVFRPHVPNNRYDQIRSHLASQAYVKDARLEDNAIRLYVENGAEVLPRVMNLLEKHGIKLEALSLSEPSLDDVFLMQTGRSLRDTHQEGVSS